MTLPDLLLPREVAKALRVDHAQDGGRRALRGLERAGRLHPVFVMKRRRYHADEVCRLLLPMAPALPRAGAAFVRAMRAQERAEMSGAGAGPASTGGPRR